MPRSVCERCVRNQVCVEFPRVFVAIVRKLESWHVSSLVQGLKPCLYLLTGMVREVRPQRMRVT